MQRAQTILDNANIS